VFTLSPDRVAGSAELAAFDDSIACSTISAEIGGIKTDELVGPDALSNPGIQTH